MKKVILYFLAFIGAFALLIILYLWLGRVAEPTMFGATGPAPIPTGEPIPTLIAMQRNSQTTNQPSENTMRGMIIRNANISLQVNNISAAMQRITQLAESSGGYVVNSNLTQDSNSVWNTTATIKIRVPAQGLNDALTALKSLATQVIQESISGEDITQQYVDLQSQLTNLQTAKEQLAKIMAGATKTADVLSVFKQLTEVQGQIDVIQGQIKYYKESVAYSSINIDLSMNPMIETAQQKQWKITEVFINSYHGLIDQLRQLTYGIIEFFVYFLPLILLWICICLVVFWIGKKIWQRFQ
ncbi:coiled-coil protein [Legionella gratiana]|uniref:Coiled-coil protein n=1 Tax=Legionella gratiana TaxID=45066 RepID=A0A378JDH1_9GAMM|nr:DUF4349 domain-containing protein [Legionella gratiana]KTD08935.1 coiled-coil protein [Legionella gratiana]STX45853.1 coiled-coil protein [Legionella gratiana]